MTTAAEVRQLVAAGAAEAQRVVFMPASVLAAPEGLRSLAREMVALANREGGRVVLGVTGHGQFEGALAANRGRAAAAVREVAAGMLVPPLDPTLEFLGDEAGEVVVVRVPRRAGGPHAAPGAAADEGPGVFIRIGDRTRTATAGQVDWMHRVRSDPALAETFAVRVPVDGLMPVVAEGPPIATVFAELLSRIPPALGAAHFADAEARSRAYAELAPWALLRDLDGLFAGHPGAVELALDEVAMPGRNSAFALVPGGLRSLLGEPAARRLLVRLLGGTRAPGFRLPAGCEPHVDTLVHQRKGRVMLAHPAWSVTFTAQPESDRGVDGAVADPAAGAAVLLRIELAVSLAFPERPEQEAPQRDAERIGAAVAGRWRRPDERCPPPPPRALLTRQGASP